ncbi:MAG: ATP-binding cassette domain-containing protein [Planctomycetes bacterium]|nr:ATP-binding cassette domain-containing protein [Planctomycetota bacterium]
MTFAVAAGDSWFVVGRNGSGKSTLLATLLGMLPPLAGAVLAPCGGDRAALGYVAQEQRLKLPLPCTVAEFVGSGLPDGLVRGEARRRIEAALATIGIAPLAHQDLRALSSGEARRTLVARAMVRRPRLLVLDEPTANLDPAATARLASDLDRLRAEGVALLHVSHDLGLARRHASHVLFVANGSAQVLAPERLATLDAMEGA